MDTLGYIAGTLTTAAFVPQVLRIWFTKSARDISWTMFIVFTAGVALWLVYGILLGTWPLILANGATLALASAILVLKWRYGRA
jgi:MtN3 and saliva related transmembrane protein